MIASSVGPGLAGVDSHFLNVVMGQHSHLTYLHEVDFVLLEYNQPLYRGCPRLIPSHPALHFHSYNIVRMCHFLYLLSFLSSNPAYEYCTKNLQGFSIHLSTGDQRLLNLKTALLKKIVLLLLKAIFSTEYFHLLTFFKMELFQKNSFKKTIRFGSRSSLTKFRA